MLTEKRSRGQVLKAGGMDEGKGNVVGKVKARALRPLPWCRARGMRLTWDRRVDKKGTRENGLKLNQYRLRPRKEKEA